MNVAVTGKEVVKSRPQAIACESEISDKKDNIEIARIKRQQLNQLQKQLAEEICFKEENGKIESSG